ncbi:MAG: NosD domain-containing protein, partial [Nanoarchaeota archaeon]
DFKVSSNMIKDNRYGIYSAYSANNSFYKNDIINNTINQAYDEGSNFWNGEGGGNYWSDYDEESEGCFDVDGDGFCDDHHYIEGGDNKDDFAYVREDGWVVVFSVNLTKGWNLFSLPLELRDNSMDILSSVDFTKLLTYDTGWSYYFNLTHNNIGIFDSTKAHWIYSTINQTLSVKGEVVDKSDFVLKDGLNFVGYPEEIEINNSEFRDYVVFTYIGNEWFSYVPGQKFNTLDILKPGHGYIILR